MSEHEPLEEALAGFRKVLPPAAVREANRAAVRAALALPAAKPWWQRSITVPLPVALATAAALLISVATHLLPARRSAALPQPILPPTAGDQRDDSSAAVLATVGPRVEYFETHRYLCGVGVIDRDVLYRFQEPTQ